MAEGYWVIRSYTAGVIGEKIKYWVPGKKPSKSERRIKSDIKQQQRNEANAVKRAARIFNENFASGYLLLGLHYDEAGLANTAEGLDHLAEDYEDRLYHAAHHQVRLWRNRARRACAAAGVELKCFIVTSDMDGKTGEYVRVHHHVIINQEALEIAIDKWKLGSTYHKALSGELDRTDLAAYLLNQVRRLPDEKKYIASRNLAIPQPKDRIAVNEAELKVPKGGQLLHRAEYRPGQPQYIRFIVPEVGRIRREREEKGAKGSQGARKKRQQKAG